MFFTKLFLHTLHGVNPHKFNQLTGANFTLHGTDITCAESLPQVIESLIKHLNGDTEKVSVTYNKSYLSGVHGKVLADHIDPNKGHELATKQGLVALDANTNLFLQSKQIVYSIDVAPTVAGTATTKRLHIYVNKCAGGYSLNVSFDSGQPKEFVMAILDATSQHASFDRLNFLFVRMQD